MIPSTKDAEKMQRRSFVKKAGALVVGAGAGLIPAAAGLVMFCDPLRRRPTDTLGWIRVASLNGLPDDGVPRKFAVIGTLADAWNKVPMAPIGAVYLRRTGSAMVQALNVVCPHAGCFVDYLAEQHDYHCPCHGSSFTLDGRIKDPRSPSPRGLDPMAVEIRNESEVWVRYQNFVAGQKERIPVA